MKRYLSLLLILLFCVAAQAQYCDYYLNKAKEYYNQGDYEQAANIYKHIVTSNCCGSNSQQFMANYEECMALAAELKDYRNCKTIKACEYYLEKYPNGKYVDKVNRILADKISAHNDSLVRIPQMLAQEDAMYERCTTVRACEEYLSAYPNGRYVSQVKAAKRELEEELSIKEKEAVKTAYMNIRKIDFANTDVNGNIIDQYGFRMIASDIKFLMPRITYDGILDDPRRVVIYWKIINPDGTIQSTPNSPAGYTRSNAFMVKPGANNTYELNGLGNSEGNTFVAGDYRMELWYERKCIYQTSFTIYEIENKLSEGSWRTALRKCNEFPTPAQEFNNGSYKGQIDNNIRTGLGMYYYNTGSCYIGNWRSNNRKGTGLYFTSQGFIKNCQQCVYYVGEWSNINKNGEGSCYDRLGNLIYRGTFVNDKPTKTYPTTGYSPYKFECIDYYDGHYYVGETKNGRCHGQGMLIWRNGDMWYGEFVDGQKDGYGIFMPYQGEVTIEFWSGGIKQ